MNCKVKSRQRLLVLRVFVFFDRQFGHKVDVQNGSARVGTIKTNFPHQLALNWSITTAFPLYNSTHVNELINYTSLFSRIIKYLISHICILSRSLDYQSQYEEKANKTFN